MDLQHDEFAFYDALTTKPQAIKDFYENEELIAITKELADTLRRNRTIDWQKRDVRQSEDAYDDKETAEKASVSTGGHG